MNNGCQAWDKMDPMSSPQNTYKIILEEKFMELPLRFVSREQT